jgi:hypothetical protein
LYPLFGSDNGGCTESLLLNVKPYSVIFQKAVCTSIFMSVINSNDIHISNMRHERRKIESKLEGKMRREKEKGKTKNWKWGVERKRESSIKAKESERNENQTKTSG